MQRTEVASDGNLNLRFSRRIHRLVRHHRCVALESTVPRIDSLEHRFGHFHRGNMLVADQGRDFGDNQVMQRGVAHISIPSVVPGYANPLTCLNVTKNRRDRVKLTAATIVSAPDTVVRSIKSPINTMAIGPNPNSNM